MRNATKLQIILSNFADKKVRIKHKNIDMKLSDLKKDDRGIITKVLGRGAFRKRIIEMGFVQGQEVEVVRSAPLGDPVYYKVMGY